MKWFVSVRKASTLKVDRMVYVWEFIHTIVFWNSTNYVINHSLVSKWERKDDVLTYPFSMEGAASVDVSYTSLAGIVFTVLMFAIWVPWMLNLWKCVNKCRWWYMWKVVQLVANFEIFTYVRTHTFIYVWKQLICVESHLKCATTLHDMTWNVS